MKTPCSRRIRFTRSYFCFAPGSKEIRTSYFVLVSKHFGVFTWLNGESSHVLLISDTVFDEISAERIRGQTWKSIPGSYFPQAFFVEKSRITVIPRGFTLCFRSVKPLGITVIRDFSTKNAWGKLLPGINFQVCPRILSAEISSNTVWAHPLWKLNGFGGISQIGRGKIDSCCLKIQLRD